MDAYEASKGESIINLLQYGSEKKEISTTIFQESFINRNLDQNTKNLAILGAGNFTNNTHLPNLQLLQDKFRIKHIINKTGYKASDIAKRCNAELISTKYFDALNDNEVDAVLIATKHNLHAEMIIESIKAKKHVFVEKPLALNFKELDLIDNALKESKNNQSVLMTGFNRRFAKISEEIKTILDRRNNPFIFNYTMNAGYLPYDHWVGIEGAAEILVKPVTYMIYLFFSQVAWLLK